MDNRFYRDDAAHSAFMGTAVVLGLWNPFLGGALAGNAQAFGELGTIANEWQDFVRRRLKEDAALFHRLGRSTRSEEVLEAYADFWHKAAEDYGAEVTTMTKLMIDMTSKAADTAQSTIEEENTGPAERRAA